MTKPVIPSEEFASRQKAVQESMKAAGFDLLICYSDDGAVFGQEYTRWLFNYQPHFEPALTIIPQEGESWIFTGVESEEYVYTSSQCQNVKVVDAFVYEAHEFPFSTSHSLGSQLVEVLGASDLTGMKVGIAGINRIPHAVYGQLQTIFGVEKFDSADQLFIDLRKVKSPAELEVIRYAYSIAQKGIEAALEALEVGKTERQVAAEAEYVMRSLGSEGMGIDTMVASGARLTRPIIARTTHKTLEGNELVTFTFAPRYEGYHAAIARPIIMGKVDDDVENAVKAAIAAQQAARDRMRPGVPGSEVDSTAREVVAQYGLAEHFVYTGAHSIGVSEFEPPSLASTYTEELTENMVFSIDIPLFFGEWGGLRYESGYIVGSEGAQPLQTLSDDIIRK